jgi:hypothetical protein
MNWHQSKCFLGSFKIFWAFNRALLNPTKDALRVHYYYLSDSGGMPTSERRMSMKTPGHSPTR